MDSSNSSSSLVVGVCNAPSSNNTAENWKLDEDFRTSGVIMGVIYSIFLVVGLPWNILVLIAIIKDKLYVQPTVILLLNLVIADLLMMTIIPFFVVTGVAGEFIFGSDDFTRCQVCRILPFFVRIFLETSLITMTLMSIDRLLYLFKPLWYERRVKAKWVVLLVLLDWVASIISAGIHFSLLQIGMFRPPLLSCDWQFTH